MADMILTHWAVLATIALALIFDFLNGFHDAANSIATIVSTRVLKPHWAVVWAAGFNFVAFLFFGLHVANTLATGLVDPAVIDTSLIFSALAGAIVWNIITWFLGIPSSSSHALIGGLVGAALIQSGTSVIYFHGLGKVVAAIVLSPLAGWLIGSLLMLTVVRLCFAASPARMNWLFRKLQLLSSALISLGHGGNDAQKTMGIIAGLLYSAGLSGRHFHVPFWVIISCNFVLALGTLAGGWRIVRTMGMRITHLKPAGGFCAETAGAITLFATTWMGIPVSTTHTMAGSIVGVGSLYSLAAVRWGIARRIVFAWFITLPAAGGMAALMACILQHGQGIK